MQVSQVGRTHPYGRRIVNCKSGPIPHCKGNNNAEPMNTHENCQASGRPEMYACYGNVTSTITITVAHVCAERPSERMKYNYNLHHYNALNYLSTPSLSSSEEFSLNKLLASKCRGLRHVLIQPFLSKRINKNSAELSSSQSNSTQEFNLCEDSSVR